MKVNTLLLFALLIILSSACSEKDGDMNPLEKEVEKDLTIKSGERVYSDDLGIKYHTMVFDLDHLKHTYKINLVEGRKYRITVTGEYCQSVRFTLMKSETEIVYIDGNTISGYCRPYFSWIAESEGTYYLRAELMKDEEFQQASNCLVVQDITPFELSYGNLRLLCSGDWSVNTNGYLTLETHQTWMYNWAKIVDHSSNYRFSYDLSLATAIPDNYFGISCFASNSIVDYFHRNLLHSGEMFEVQGPTGFRIFSWDSIMGSYNYGSLPSTIHFGSDSWFNLGVEVNGDTAKFIADGEFVGSTLNYNSVYSGLYIMVYDTKRNTVHFKDLKFRDKI